MFTDEGYLFIYDLGNENQLRLCHEQRVVVDEGETLQNFDIFITGELFIVSTMDQEGNDKLIAYKVKSQVQLHASDTKGIKQPQKEVKSDQIEKWEFNFADLKEPEEAKKVEDNEDPDIHLSGFHKIYINFLHKGIPIIFAFKKAEKSDLFVGKLGKEGIQQICYHRDFTKHRYIDSKIEKSCLVAIDETMQLRVMEFEMV